MGALRGLVGLLFSWRLGPHEFSLCCIPLHQMHAPDVPLFLSAGPASQGVTEYRGVSSRPCGDLSQLGWRPARTAPRRVGLLGIFKSTFSPRDFQNFVRAGILRGRARGLPLWYTLKTFTET